MIAVLDQTWPFALVMAHGITRDSEGALRDDQQLKLVAQLLEAAPNSITGRDRVFAVIIADRVRETNTPPTTEPRNDLKLSASHVAWASTIVPIERW